MFVCFIFVSLSASLSAISLDGCSFTVTRELFSRIAIKSYAQEICDDSREMLSLSVFRYYVNCIIHFSKLFPHAEQLLCKLSVVQSDI